MPTGRSQRRPRRLHPDDPAAAGRVGAHRWSHRAGHPRAHHLPAQWAGASVVIFIPLCTGNDFITPSIILGTSRFYTITIG